MLPNCTQVASNPRVGASCDTTWSNLQQSPPCFRNSTNIGDISPHSQCNNVSFCTSHPFCFRRPFFRTHQTRCLLLTQIKSPNLKPFRQVFPLLSCPFSFLLSRLFLYNFLFFRNCFLQSFFAWDLFPSLFLFICSTAFLFFFSSFLLGSICSNF